MAKRLDEKTTNGSRVTPKTAGIESTYKKLSQHSNAKLTTNSTRNTQMRKTYCKCNVTELDNSYSKKQRGGLPKMFDPC